MIFPQWSNPPCQEKKVPNFGAMVVANTKMVFDAGSLSDSVKDLLSITTLGGACQLIGHRLTLPQ